MSEAVVDHLSDKLGNMSVVKNGGIEQSEAIRVSTVQRKKNFKSMEKVNGRLVNVVEGIELHAGVFSAAEQQRIVDCVYQYQDRGRKGLLRERTYSEPRKWMRGKGRVTIQFGCCYNYSVDKKGNPPGIIRDEEVDPIPPLLKGMIIRMVEWHVLPPTCIPNSCIVNIYDKDDCIPPHIDHHDFVRPFCTVSFLSECNILFGRELKVLAPGEFDGSVSIPLPTGSVLILQGNGADVAKHCIPAVPAKRISITFRKMDDSKMPFRFTPDPQLQNLRPLLLPPIRHAVGQPASLTPTSQAPQQATAQAHEPREQRTTPSTPMLATPQEPSRTPQSQTLSRSSQAQAPSRSPQAQTPNRTPLPQVRHPNQNSGFSSDDFPPLGSSSMSTGRRGRR